MAPASSKAKRRVLAAAPGSAILRTAWVYSPFGKNFARTMLTLAKTRDELGVVDDQRGSPTSALSLADTVLAVARNLRSSTDPALRGVFHAVDGGEASWADFAAAIFEISAGLGGPSARVRRIATADYPTPARRPANSRLDIGKLAARHGVTPPHWREALAPCVARLIEQEGIRRDDGTQGNRAGGRFGHPPLSNDDGDIETAPADLRQAADLLSHRRPHAGRVRRS